MLFFKYIYIWRKGKERRKRQGETLMSKGNIDQWSPTWAQPWTKSVTQACALTGNRTGNPLLRGMTPNQLSHTGKGSVLFLSIRKCDTNFCIHGILNFLPRFSQDLVSLELNLPEANFVLSKNILGKHNFGVLGNFFKLLFTLPRLKESQRKF